jgi:hypothetical protein
MAELRFQEAINFLAGKVNLPTKKYDDLRHGAHVRAFSVAGVTRDDMLSDFRAAIERARTEGTTLDDFRKTFDEIVDRTGWKFNARGSTEEERRAWRARIIYTTNMRTSYMAGRYAQLTDPDVLRYRPWWRYKHSHALHPRLLHLSWDGKVWAADNPIWKIIFPPNGWGCGCDVEALSDRQMRALGKFGADPDPDLAPYQAKDPRTGQAETRYRGVDRGWEYNVGEEWLQGVVPTELRQPLPAFGATQPARDLPPMPEPRPAPAADVLAPDLEPTDYAKAFLKPFGTVPGEETYFRDKSGGIVGIDKALFQDRTSADGLQFSGAQGQYAILLAQAIIDPDEIWVDWAAIGNSVVLRRSYIRRMLLPSGQELLIKFAWTKAGWRAIANVGDAGAIYAGRTGALLYRRTEGARQ